MTPPRERRLAPYFCNLNSVFVRADNVPITLVSWSIKRLGIHLNMKLAALTTERIEESMDNASEPSKPHCEREYANYS